MRSQSAPGVLHQRGSRVSGSHRSCQFVLCDSSHPTTPIPVERQWTRTGWSTYSRSANRRRGRSWTPGEVRMDIGRIGLALATCVLLLGGTPGTAAAASTSPPPRACSATFFDGDARLGPAVLPVIGEVA